MRGHFLAVKLNDLVRISFSLISGLGTAETQQRDIDAALLGSGHSSGNWNLDGPDCLFMRSAAAGRGNGDAQYTGGKPRPPSHLGFHYMSFYWFVHQGSGPVNSNSGNGTRVR